MSCAGAGCEPSGEASIQWEGIMTDAKITTIQDIYEAFGRGDIG